MSDTRPKANFIPVRDPERPEKILFRFDPRRDIIEVKPKGGRLQRVDLTQYRESDGEA